MHIINWEMVIADKGQEDLNMKQMKTMHVALMAKLGWKILTKIEKLWV